MVTGQAPVTLELRDTPGKKTQKPKVVYRIHAYITADAIHASPRKHIKSEIVSQPTICQVHLPVHTSHHSRLKKPTIPLAIQERLLRTEYILHLPSAYHYAYARQTRFNWKKKQRKERKRKESKENKRKRKREDRKEKKRLEKQEMTRQEEEAREKKRKKRHTSRP